MLSFAGRNLKELTLLLQVNKYLAYMANVLEFYKSKLTVYIKCQYSFHLAALSKLPEF